MMMTEEMMNKHSKIWRVFQGNLDDFLSGPKTNPQFMNWI